MEQINLFASGTCSNRLFWYNCLCLVLFLINRYIFQWVVVLFGELLFLQLIIVLFDRLLFFPIGCCSFCWVIISSNGFLFFPIGCCFFRWLALLCCGLFYFPMGYFLVVHSCVWYLFQYIVLVGLFISGFFSNGHYSFCWVIVLFGGPLFFSISLFIYF